MKYTVIIADDEPKIIQLIKQLGHWDALGIEIVAECTTGQDAYDCICQFKPDLVLSDIKMPVFDGLELIKRVRQAEINPFFVLISGYRHFEYARSAVQLNVVDYLLKPIQEEQLNQVLEKVCLNIDSQRQEQLNMATLSDLQPMRQLLLREKFWEPLLKGMWEKESLPHLCSIEACNEMLGMDITHGCFLALCIVSSLNAMFEEANSLGNLKIEHFIEENLNHQMQVYYNRTFMGYVLIFNYQPEQRESVRLAIKALYYYILDLREVYGEMKLNFGISSETSDFSELSKILSEALSAEWGRLMTAGNGIMEFKQIEQLPQISVNSPKVLEYLDSIVDSVRYFRIEALGKTFGELSKAVREKNDIFPGVLQKSFYHLEEKLLLCVPQEKKERFRENYYYTYLNARNYVKLVENLYLMLVRYIEEELQGLKEKKGKPIIVAVQYIQAHFREQIALRDVAEAVGVSETYLSKLFKSEMNIGFNDYLTQFRLKESERLLAKTNLPVKRIALQVGYLDEKYFSKLFKKETGIKPTDYRRIYG